MSTKAQTFLQRHFIDRKIGGLPLREAVSITPDLALDKVVQQLAFENVGCLTVVNAEGTLVGILSERDIVRRAYAQGRDLSEATASSAMSADPKTLPDYASLGRALYFMAVGQFRHIPIISRPPQRTLMLSVRDLVDLIYSKIAAPAISSKEDELVDPSALAEFFHDPISKLKPDPAISVAPATTVADGLAKMDAHHIGSLVVCDQPGKVIGIFTERDYVQRVAAKQLDPKSTTLDAVMTPQPKTVLEGSSIALAFSAFSEGKYRHLPIVNSNENLQGVLSVRSFVKALSKGIIDDLGKSPGKSEP